MDILDQILAAEMANQYTDSQQLARIIKKTVTHDGNSDGKDILPGEIPMVLASSIPIDTDRETVKRITVYEDGETNVVDTFVISQEHDETSGCVITTYSLEIAGNKIPMVTSVSDSFSVDGLIIKKGVYFLSVEGMYVSCLETETVHQIDPKFIPLPYSVVELSNPVVMEQFANIELTDADKEELENAVAADKPIYIKFKNEQDVTYEAFADIMRFETGFQVSVSIHQMVGALLVVAIATEEGEWGGLITYTWPESAATTAET